MLLTFWTYLNFLFFPLLPFRLRNVTLERSLYLTFNRLTRYRPLYRRKLCRRARNIHHPRLKKPNESSPIFYQCKFLFAPHYHISFAFLSFQVCLWASHVRVYSVELSSCEHENCHSDSIIHNLPYSILHPCNLQTCIMKLYFNLQLERMSNVSLFHMNMSRCSGYEKRESILCLWLWRELWKNWEKFESSRRSSPTRTKQNLNLIVDYLDFFLSYLLIMQSHLNKYDDYSPITFALRVKKRRASKFEWIVCRVFFENTPARTRNENRGDHYCYFYFLSAYHLYSY